MAFAQIRQTDSYLAIATLAAKRVVTLSPTVANSVIVSGSVGQRPIGVTDASALPDQAVTVNEESSIAKVLCVASVGANTVVGVASTNGGVGPVTGASGVTRWALGVSRTPAAAGETLSVHINPQQLSNLI